MDASGASWFGYNYPSSVPTIEQAVSPDASTVNTNVTGKLMQWVAIFFVLIVVLQTLGR